MRTRRASRAKILKESGFLPFETRALSKVPFSVPYVRPLIKARMKAHLAYIAKGNTEAQWHKFIRQEYRDHDWMQAGVYDPWQMLRDREHRYRAKYPDYESPWESKRVKRSSAEFERKVANTIIKQKEQWLKDLDQSIAKATGERRRQLEAQRANLMAS